MEEQEWELRTKKFNEEAIVLLKRHPSIRPALKLLVASIDQLVKKHGAQPVNQISKRGRAQMQKDIHALVGELDTCISKIDSAEAREAFDKILELLGEVFRKK